MNVLITGAGGFVGHHAIPYLITNTNWNLVLIDSFKHLGTSARLRESLKSIPKEQYSRIKVVSHDLSTPIDKMTAQELGDINVIINYASLSDVDDSIETPVPFIQNNINLCLYLLEYARTLHNLNLFVQISTDEVYGPLLTDRLHPEGDSFNPSSPYAASKVGQEAILNAYWKTYDMPIIITNSMNMFGERQYEKSFIPKIILYLLNNKVVPVHVKKINDIIKVSRRSYTHAINQIDAIKFLINNLPQTSIKASQGLLKIEKFNIAGYTVIQNDDLVYKIADILNINKDKIIEYTDPVDTRPGLDIAYGLDVSKIHNLGWKEIIPFDEGLERTVTWFKNNQSWL